MADIVITARYRLVLNSWKNGAITIRQVELLVKTGYITREQADTIYTYPRLQTSLALKDPWSPETVQQYRNEQSPEATN